MVSQGTMIAGADLGAVAEHMTYPQITIIRIQVDEAVSSLELRLPVRPMIGVVGTAPAPITGDIPDGTPGTHGGNVDCKLIGSGATLYLPVFVERANLAMGDLHAVMADGEVAAENLIPHRSLPGLVLETTDAFDCRRVGAQPG